MTKIQRHWLLPEGVDELLPEQAARLERLRRRLLDTYASWGYRLVITPFVEYLESLLTGVGKDLEHQTFKMTDPLSGKLLGIRADITPQVARIDAHQLRHEEPVRLCYMGSVFRTRSDGFSATRSPLQIGAELYGHAGVESDLEILCLMMATLSAAGIDNVFLDLGHVGIFRGLAEEAGLDAGQERALFAALQRKAVPEIRSLVQEFSLPAGLAEQFVELAGLNGKADVLDRAVELFKGASDQVRDAVEYVRRAGQMLESCLPELPVHYDLAELRGYQYQNGLVFAAFVPGAGKEIARGGRYDDIGAKFGCARPATGFSTDLKTLMRFGREDRSEKQEKIFAPWEGDADLDRLVDELRRQGGVVVRELPGQKGDARAMGCTHELVRSGDGWQKVALE
ncbi:MAG: ATP phosphoribosyltransferase regulatory subunit [Gammaproteobacteria bacterium]|nr:MAG: ATP phosphoribosyltransferase regulatory subunit [Gammaproteobacteria bacterium]RTZ76212.1 MAG: ATP phosphoribosyltransferase regulatory subunit [Gammaproteobacteria bacterium]RTZ81130.1 MAG: ATP phosphoribosyltransferase regulatory subunit [Gammaproteobacteria bacterium]